MNGAAIAGTMRIDEPPKCQYQHGDQHRQTDETLFDGDIEEQIMAMDERMIRDDPNILRIEAVK